MKIPFSPLHPKLQIVAFIILLLSTQSFSQHFSNIWSGNPFQPMNIIIQEATISENNMEIGDEIAVFDIGEDGSSICVGCLILTDVIIPGSPAVIIASADDDLTDGISNGYIPNNEIVFKLWDSSESLEITWVSPTFNDSYATVYAPLETAVVTLSTCFESDFDCDCDVDIIDVTIAAYRYGTIVGDANYDAQYDLDGDGDIDIVDITMVAYNYGWTCGDKANYSINFDNTNNDNVVLGFAKTSMQNTSDGSFQIELFVENIDQLGGYELELAYNPNELQITNVEQGSFIESTGRKVVPLQSNFDNTQGIINFSTATLGANINGAKGNGSLIVLTCIALQTNFKMPNLINATLVRIDANIIDFKLKQNQINETNTETYIITTYPSPFIEEMTIQYRVGQAGNISFKVFDIYGKLLRETENVNREIGDYERTFERTLLCSGVYIYSLEYNGLIISSKRVVIN